MSVWKKPRIEPVLMCFSSKLERREGLWLVVGLGEGQRRWRDSMAANFLAVSLLGHDRKQEWRGHEGTYMHMPYIYTSVDSIPLSQGLENVGSWATGLIHKAGGKVVAMTDMSEATHDKNGIDIPSLMKHLTITPRNKRI